MATKTPPKPVQKAKKAATPDSSPKVVVKQVKRIDPPKPKRVSRKGKAPPIVYNSKSIRAEREAEEKARGFDRPKKPTPAIVNEILDLIEAGFTLTEIISDRGDMPSVGCWYMWLRADEALADRYARAKEIQCESMAMDIVRLSNTPRKGIRTVTRSTKDGTFMEVTEGDAVDRTRLQVEARRWYLEKIMPKRFGTKVDVNHTGEVRVVLQQGDEKL